MDHRFKTVLALLVTTLAMGIVGFGCYRSGYKEGSIDTERMYGEMVEFRSNEAAVFAGFSEDNLQVLLERLNVRFPEIVMAQARLETGHFSSRIYLENNNLFGMKQAYRRPSTCKGIKHGHCYYDDWLDSVIDYALYQKVFLSHVQSHDEYLGFLGESYAQDPRYTKKLKLLIEHGSVEKKTD
jgi:hypothetical protein